MSDEVTISDEEFNQPLKSSMPPLELLPEFQPIYGTISEVKLQVKMFNNQPVSKKDKDGNEILGEDGQPQYMREFKITINLKDQVLANGKPRQAWLQLTCSLHEKSKLPKVLKSLFGDYSHIQTPAQVITALIGLEIVFQFENRTNAKGKVYQTVMFNTVRKA